VDIRALPPTGTALGDPVTWLGEVAELPPGRLRPVERAHTLRIMNYRFRRPTQDDLPAVIDLAATIERVDYGDEDDPTEYLTTLFKVMEAGRDAWVVEDAEGRIVATGIVRVRHPTRIRTFTGVHPEHRGKGIGSELLTRIEERAGEAAQSAPEGEDVFLGVDDSSTNGAARRLFESRGYEHIRYFWKMGIDLDEEPPQPEWPEGIRFERARRGEEREVFDASEEAFQDHWDHHPHEYDEWRQWMVDTEFYDPELWLLARDEDEIAGLSLLFLDPGEGWVGVLGVRRPWRKRGLGRALLLASFHEIRGRGKPRAVLGVDAANPTGATRLYEGAGMRVISEAAAYRKKVR
jgi:mycothiol synthase